MKPKLFSISTHQHSIRLKWEAGEGFYVYRIEMKDKTYSWLTKYWGFKKECEVKGLGPETLHHFRLGVSSEVGGEEVFSDILSTPTKDAPPMMFYLFKSVERRDHRCLTSFLAGRKDSAAIDGYDRSGDTALIKAVKSGEVWSVRKLLSADANPDEGGYITSRRPLDYACSLGKREVAEIILEAGANINLPDCNKCTPLHYAADSNNLDMLKLCIESGSKVNTKDSVGWSPLIRAVVFNSGVEIIEELIASGGDVQLRDKNGRTALDHARINNSTALIEKLEAFTRREVASKEDMSRKGGTVVFEEQTMGEQVGREGDIQVDERENHGGCNQGQIKRGGAEGIEGEKDPEGEV